MHTVADLYAEVIGVLAQAKWVAIGACHHQDKQGRLSAPPQPPYREGGMREFRGVLMLCVPCLRNWPKGPQGKYKSLPIFFSIFFFRLTVDPAPTKGPWVSHDCIREGAGPVFCPLCPNIPKKFISFKSFFRIPWVGGCDLSSMSGKIPF